MSHITILIADDHLVVREGIKQVLATDGDVRVVGEASNGAEAVRMVGVVKPDVVLMDVRMPEMDGIAATRCIKSEFPGTAVIMLTMYENEIYVIDAVEAGAVGYLLKDASHDLLLHTIRAAHSGVTLIKSSVLRAALAHTVEREAAVESLASHEALGAAPNGNEPPHNSAEPGVADLALLLPSHKGMTPREFEVLALMVQGCTNREIGQKLFITALTVKKHVSSIIGKLDAVNRSDAAVRAVRAGLMPRK